VLIALAVAAIVFSVRALGISDMRFAGKDYGAFALAVAALLIAVRLFNWFAYDFLFRLRRGFEAPALLREITALVVFLFGAALILKAFLSVKLTAFLATSALITAVIGLALQDTLGNLFAGLALHLEKSLQVGDLVRVGETIGFVEELSWRAVKVRTFLDSRLLVPNGVAAREKLEVFPRSAGPIGQSLKLYLDYRVSPQRVMELLERTAASVRGVVAHPAPLVYLHQFGEYAIQYEVRYWLENYARFPQIDSDLRERIWYALGREGLTIPLPASLRYQYTRNWEPEPPPASEVATILDGVEILTPLSAEEREKLAGRLKHVVFAPGENVFVEGSQAHSLYIVERGELVVVVLDRRQREVEVGRLSAGDAFGEMALLTGEPRSATVRAKTEAALVRIDKDAFAEVLASNTGLVAQIVHLMEARRERSQDALDRARDTSKTGPLPAGTLLTRIARFFALEELS
jgi:small-conductance mechanosensitive channel/CRP-like cAMP-binding protein